MGDRCRCGAELLAHLHFCVGCGVDREAASRPLEPASRPMATAPPTWQAPGQPATSWQGPAPATAWQAPAPRPWSPAPWLVALSILLVLLISAGAVLVTLRPELLAGEPTPAAAAPVVEPQAAEPSQAAAPALTARDELAAQVDRDRAQVESVTGSWVPQLSSKRPGTVDSGVTYDDGKILSHYRGLAGRYPGTALLWSGDWPVFKGDDYWVVVLAQQYSTAAQANAWCDAQGFGPDDCLAKNLSHSGDPAGTTVPR